MRILWFLLAGQPVPSLFVSHDCDPGKKAGRAGRESLCRFGQACGGRLALFGIVVEVDLGWEGRARWFLKRE